MMTKKFRTLKEVKPVKLHLSEIKKKKSKSWGLLDMYLCITHTVELPLGVAVGIADDLLTGRLLVRFLAAPVCKAKVS